MRSCLLLLLLLTGATAHAQSRLTSTLGVSLATVTDAPDGADPYLGLTASVVIALPLAPAFALETGLGYVARGSNVASTLQAIGDTTTFPATLRLRYAYLDLPLVARATVPLGYERRVDVYGGVHLAVLLDEGLSYGSGTGVIPLGSNLAASTDPQWSVGVRAWLGRYGVDVRYVRGFGSFTRDDVDPTFQDLRHQVLALQFAYRL